MTAAAATPSSQSDESSEANRRAEVHRVLQGTNPQAVLGLVAGQKASKAEVRRLYLRLSLLVHPDKCDDPRAAEAFRRLSDAYRHIAEGAPWVHGSEGESWFDSDGWDQGDDPFEAFRRAAKGFAASAEDSDELLKGAEDLINRHGALAVGGAVGGASGLAAGAAIGAMVGGSIGALFGGALGAVEAFEDPRCRCKRGVSNCDRCREERDRRAERGGRTGAAASGAVDGGSLGAAAGATIGGTLGLLGGLLSGVVAGGIASKCGIVGDPSGRTESRT